MIDLYTWGTPNGRKVSIMLEETGLAYRVHKIDISKGDQFKPDFVAINPNSKIPAIVDGEGPGGKPITLFESGAILIYLGQDGKASVQGPGVPLRRARMADVPDGRRWPDVRPSAPLPACRAGAGALCDRAIRQGDAPTLRRAGRAAQDRGLSGRRVFDCRHRDVSLGRAARVAQGRARRFPERGALVSRDRRSTRGRPRDAGAA